MVTKSIATPLGNLRGKKRSDGVEESVENGGVETISYWAAAF
jgi:hypothetical protein